MSPTIDAVLTRLAACAAALVLVPTGRRLRERLVVHGRDGGHRRAATPPTPPARPARTVDPPPSSTTLHGSVPLTLDTSVGTLKATLDATAAPCTVSSFVSLAKQGYFDNTPCHRLTTRGIYVLQCGDPTGTGTGGPGYTVPDELSGSETYGPGVLAMANTGQPNSGGSQFFIVYRDSTASLGKLYTVFGKLDAASVATIQQVAAKGTDNSNGPGDGHPKEKVTITKATTG